MGEKVLTFLGRGEVWIVASVLAAYLVLIWVLRARRRAAPWRARRMPTPPSRAVASAWSSASPSA